MDKKFLIGLIFPPRCMFCGEVLPADTLCPECKPKAEHLSMADTGRKINHSCFKNLDSCIAFFRYEGLVRDGILYAKYKSCDGFIRQFMEYMDFDFAQYFAENGIDEFISVPFYKSKLYNREYDLPKEMAAAIAKSCNVKYNKDLVTKVKATRNQHDLSVTDRKTNLKDAFCVNGDIKGKNIAVLDDILSTGYSMEEVAKVLKKAGANKVIGISFAYNNK